MRKLRDRLAELLRRCRLGSAGGEYSNLPDELQEEWRTSADYVISNAPSFGIEIKDERR